MKVIILGFLSLIILNLSGCASMMSPPTCPDSTGLQCARVDQINHLVDSGQLGVPVSNVTPTGTTPKGISGPYDNFSTPYPSGLKTSQPLWNGETVMRIWLAPYEDKQGNYHQASSIDTIVKPGHWIGMPLKVVTNESESRG